MNLREFLHTTSGQLFLGWRHEMLGDDKTASPAPQPEPTRIGKLVEMLSTLQMLHDPDGQWLIAEQGLEALRDAGIATFNGRKWISAEQPSQPAGARERMTAEEFHKQVWRKQRMHISDGRRDFYMEMEAYAKKERERADAAEQLVRDLKRDRQWLLANFCYAHGQMNLHTSGPCGMCRANNAEAELRDMREALRELIDNKPGSWRHAKALLSRKGEGS